MSRPTGLIVTLVLAVFVVLSTRRAEALTVQVPEGGRAIPVLRAGQPGLLCGPLPGGWLLEPDRRSVRPPSADAPNLAHVIVVKVADDAASCSTTTQAAILVATGAWPDIDSAGVAFFPDDGRVELRGQRLKGVQLVWPTPPPHDLAKDVAKEKDVPKEGRDVCLDPQTSGKAQTCVIPVAPGLATDATLRWLPANARSGPDVVTFDAFGAEVDPAAWLLRPARIVLSKPFFIGNGIDISQGPGRVILSHPEAAGQVDCGGARCDLAEGAVIVRSVPGPATTVTMRVRLATRVTMLKGDASESAVTATLPLLTCPLTVVSGAPLRDVSEPAVVVRMEGACGRDPRSLHFSVGGLPATVERVERVGESAFVVLRTDRLTADKLTVTVARGDLDLTTVAATTVATQPAPKPRVSLELGTHGRVDFIPTNRPATVTVAGAGASARLVVLPSEGAYDVTSRDGAFFVRGDENAGGFASLRFGYRVPGLPAALGAVDLGIINENVQRAVREASVPAPIGQSAFGRDPLVELVCHDPAGPAGVGARDLRLAPGQPGRIPYRVRDTCRVIIHRERLKPEDGAQEIVLEVEVTKPDGSARSEAHIEERMVLRSGNEPRIVAIRSGLQQFDKLVVRVAHVADESRYVLNAVSQARPAAAVQWSAVVEGGLVRLYATAAVPAGLYRVNEPSGQLTLNFGVLSRLVKLDREGKESLLGFEMGVMGVGLIPATTGQSFPRTLAVVAGMGLRVPLGGGAAISVNAWVAREFRDNVVVSDCPDKTDFTCGLSHNASRWSFIFGPSIAVGNVGMNL